MAKFIEFKNQGTVEIAEVVANKGICWLVKAEGEDGTFLVQKKHVTRGPWEETDDTPDAEQIAANAAATGTLAASLNGLQAQPAPAPVKKDAPAPAERDPNLVTLKQLCFDLALEPRIARRRLRKAIGQVGTGSRWEWIKDSPELAAVQAVLVGTMPTDDPEALSAEDQAVINSDAEPAAE